MPIQSHIQPEILKVSDTLRLRRYDGDCGCALSWYQDRETLLAVNGNDKPYDADRLQKMYDLLAARGEEYWIEALCGGEFVPIGDVTLMENDIAIVIGEKGYRRRGIGKAVLRTLIRRARELCLPALTVREIYRENEASIRLFTGCGFVRCAETARGASYRLPLAVLDALNEEGTVIRHAREADLPQIFAIYARARQFMAENGNPTQWGKTSPEPKLVKQDIADHISFVVCGADDIPQGVFVLVSGEDPTYAVIDGSWLSDTPYCAVHRVASSGQRKGVAHAAMRFAFGVFPNIRIDTHENNRVMQNFLQKEGFTRCGIITVSDGTPRIAYQKMI